MYSRLLILSLISLISFSSAVFFHIEEGKERCFVEEVPSEVLVLGHYKAPDLALPITNERERFGIRIQVTNPNKEVILAEEAEAEGKFAFTSHMGGEHHICITTTSAHWFGSARKFRFHLRIDIGESATNYAELAKQEHLSAIEIELRKLNDKVRAIRGEQAYQRTREESFRNTSESTNSRVVWWSIIQTVILLASGIYQIIHLQNFFKAKKLN